LEHGDYKNSSIHMKNIFTTSDKTFELPKIGTQGKPSPGPVVLNWKSLDKIWAQNIAIP